MLTGLIALGIFGTILLFMQGCILLHRLIVPRGTDRAVQRIQKWTTAPEMAVQLDIVRKESLSDIPWLNDLLTTMHRFEPLRVLHRQADCRVPLGVFVLAMALLAVSGLFVGFTMHVPFLLTAALAAVLGVLPPGFLYWQKRKRMATLERQLPEALELMSRALKAGHAFSVGLKLVAEESADPLGLEFRRVFEEVSMGVSLPQAMQNMTDRLNSVDIKFFVTSVLVQRETGGNLAEIIDSLATLIRKRFELQMKVKALSAEGRFSAIVLFILPLFVAGALFKVNPEYIGLLFTDPFGQNMGIATGILMLTGAAVMKRMVDIRV
jgi:tight adherence protein B